MCDLALDDLPADRQERIERCRRVLEDDPDVLAAHAAQGLGFRADDLLPGEADRTLHVRSAGEEPGRRERRDALA